MAQNVDSQMIKELEPHLCKHVTAIAHLYLHMQVSCVHAHTQTGTCVCQWPDGH